MQENEKIMENYFFAKPCTLYSEAKMENIVLVSFWSLLLLVLVLTNKVSLTNEYYL